MAMPPTQPGYTTTESGLFMPVDLRADTLSDLRSPTAWLVDWAGGRSVAGQPVSPQRSLALPTYYACLNVIAQDCAKLPLPILRDLDPGSEKVKDHPLYPVLQKVLNPDMTAYIGRYVMTHWAVGWGNGYGLILRDRSMTTQDGEPTGIYPLHPSRVTPRRDAQTGQIVYDVRTTGYRDTQAIPERVLASDMIHLKGYTADGLCGISIAQLAAESLGLSLAAQDYGAGFFGNSSVPSGILKHPGQISNNREKLEKLRQQWDNRRNGTAILEEGMSWEQVSIPPEQAQFLETRQFQAVEICRWFRMSPHKVQILDNAHYNNIEQQGIEHVQDTLMPWLVMWEQELWMKLLAPDMDLFARHDTRALLRGDSAARANYYKALFSVGAYSPNDILALEDYNPYPGGDKHFLQIQYAPVESISAGTARAPRGLQRPNAPPAYQNGHAAAIKDDD